MDAPSRRPGVFGRDKMLESGLAVAAARPKGSLAVLILTRRVGETVVIGRDIMIEVLGTSGSQVRLGIHAPADIEVHRGEVAERIELERPTAKRGKSRS